MENNRYSCQIKLPGFGEEAQQKLLSARVLIIGIGGLGCPCAQYLAAAGIGTIGLADDDTVSVTNLHRQVLFNESDAGKEKVVVAAERLRAQNPSVRIVTHHLRVDAMNIMSLIADYDLLIDCTDNFETRYLINDAAVLSDKAVVYGGIYQYEGQVAVWNVSHEDGTRSANYRDVFPNVDPAQVPDCSDGGVLPMLAGIIGCMQAAEVVKYFTSSDDLLRSRLLVFDARSMSSNIIKLQRNSSAIITELPRSGFVDSISFAAITAAHFLVDVRTIEEHNARNIGGVNIPLAELSDRLDEIPRGQKIVCYCTSGKRSAAGAKKILSKYPGAEVYSLLGGIDNAV